MRWDCRELTQLPPEMAARRWKMLSCSQMSFATVGSSVLVPREAGQGSATISYLSPKGPCESKLRDWGFVFKKKSGKVTPVSPTYEIFWKDRIPFLFIVHSGLWKWIPNKNPVEAPKFWSAMGHLQAFGDWLLHCSNDSLHKGRQSEHSIVSNP